LATADKELFWQPETVVKLRGRGEGIGLHDLNINLSLSDKRKVFKMNY